MSEDLRQRYAAALDMTEPFAEHLLDAMMAVRDEEMARLQAALDAAELALHEAIGHADDTCPAAAAVERVRRMAQVWVDIRPVRPTATREGHVLADAGQRILDALDGE